MRYSTFALSGNAGHMHKIWLQQQEKEAREKNKRHQRQSALGDDGQHLVAADCAKSAAQCGGFPASSEKDKTHLRTCYEADFSSNRSSSMISPDAWCSEATD
eukprot:CAMPEP_0194534066 /NCGR_PEP_ID=MMETSP0253-20130528/72103_1 /TAXON_ID=2966 /ORGANISM="Noctiluca scintillans" /LENGTH=101 /DNA_ID=CAMNT_0039379679 /DNA_START=25 /DNA_END=330 /DNA_ORIENTATION=+